MFVFHVWNFIWSPAITICYIKMIAWENITMKCCHGILFPHRDSHGCLTINTINYITCSYCIRRRGDWYAIFTELQTLRLELNDVLRSWSLMLCVQCIKLTWPMNTEWAKLCTKKYANVSTECTDNPLTRLSGLSLHLGNVLLLNANQFWRWLLFWSVDF